MRWMPAMWLASSCGLKDVSDDEMRRAAEALMPIAQERGTSRFSSMTGRILRRNWAPTACISAKRMQVMHEARRAVGSDKIVGVTCHNSRHLAIEAAELGADYVAFGAFYPTQTKQSKTDADPELLRWWSELMVVPCVAIGGITVENAPPLVDAGADFLAVSAGVWSHPSGPFAAVKAFTALLHQY